MTTKQEKQVTLEALIREKDNELNVLERLASKAEAAKERGDETEALRLEAEHSHHTEILQAVKRELKNASGEATQKKVATR